MATKRQLLLHQQLQYDPNHQEASKIVKNNKDLIKADRKVSRDIRKTLDQMDVLSIDCTNGHFRILSEVKILTSQNRCKGMLLQGR
jgi:ribosomal protein S4E